jgi:hypothetical protein
MAVAGERLAKRLSNKRPMESFNRVHDATPGYEFLNLYMPTLQAKALGQGLGEDRL